MIMSNLGGSGGKMISGLDRNSHIFNMNYYPDDIARLWHSDRYVLAAWFYCDHQGAIAEYGLHPSRSYR